MSVIFINTLNSYDCQIYGKKKNRKKSRTLEIQLLTAKDSAMSHQ